MLLTKIRCSNNSLYPFYLRTALSAIPSIAKESKISTCLYSVSSKKNRFLKPIRRHSLYAANSSVYDNNILLSPLIRWCIVLYLEDAFNIDVPRLKKIVLSLLNALLIKTNISDVTAFISRRI
jgi:hypothetical protein